MDFVIAVLMPAKIIDPKVRRTKPTPRTDCNLTTEDL